MKDKDFDDIGKRLYDMEAEPPKDGWKKIVGGVNNTPVVGKIIFLRKNWWKPLVLLIPLGVYLLLHGTDETTSKVPPGSNSDTLALNSKIESGKTTAELNQTNNPDLTEKEEDSNNQQFTNHIADKNHGKTSSEDISAPFGENKELNKSSKSDTQITDASYAKSLIPIKAEKVVPTELSQFSDSLPSSDSSPDLENNEGESTMSTLKKDANKTTSRHPVENMVAIKAMDTEKDLAPGQNASGNDGADGKKGASVEAAKSSLYPIAEIPVAFSSPLHQNTTQEVKGKENINNERKVIEKPIDADSIKFKELTTDTTVLVSTDIQKENEDNESASSSWRMTFALTPQYTTETIKPIANDEVLMIDMSSKNGFYQEQIGLGIALGFGRAISPDFYLDAHLTYHQVKQEVSYSFSTGEVDTLLALQQPDGSIRVSPVYDMHDANITSQYSYGGVRISGTYYFWSRPKRRFNITAGAGIDQLLSSSLEENIDGESIPKNGDYLKNPNYNFVIGAGYNIRFRRGWELMINPTMTYYLLKEKSEDSLYNFNQRSYGLNFMLSKTISFKK
jgi:hypothetical protein